MNFNKKITRERLRKFLREHASGGKALDLGCGDKYYDNLFPNRITVDIDEARKPDIVADAHKLPFKEGEFDIILCTEVLEHLLKPQEAIKEMQRILKSGGELILTTRFIFPLHDVPCDYFRFTKYGLEELFKDWDIKSIEAETGSLETLAVLLQRMIFQAKFRANKLTKSVLFVLLKLFLFLNKFTKKEFGNIEQTRDEKNILTSGYYLIARKK